MPAKSSKKLIICQATGSAHIGRVECRGYPLNAKPPKEHAEPWKSKADSTTKPSPRNSTKRLFDLRHVGFEHVHAGCLATWRL